MNIKAGCTAYTDPSVEAVRSNMSAIWPTVVVWVCIHFMSIFSLLFTREEQLLF